MAERTKATHLKTVVLRTPVNESLDLKEAPSNEGAFLVSETPPIGKAPGVGYLEGRGIRSWRVRIYRVTVLHRRWPFSILPGFTTE